MPEKLKQNIFRKITPYFNYYIRIPFLKKISPKEGTFAYRNLFQDLRILAGKDDPVVIDGGGNQGDWTVSILRTFKSPSVVIFEPHPVSFNKIKERFFRLTNIKAVNKALGSGVNILPFNLADSPASSSFLSRTERIHGTKMETKRIINMKTVRLDDEIDQKIDILKLDLEGFELKALKGAEKILQDVKIIVTEVEFEPIYENAPLYEDIAIWLRNKGFFLFNFYETYTQKSGQLTVGDALFIKRIT